MAADSSNSYVVNFSVYLGCEGEIQRRHLLGYNVVMGITRPFFNRKHHVFFDNFFSSLTCSIICLHKICMLVQQ